MEDLINRGNLSLSLVERMITMVSEKLRERLLSQYKISPELISSFVEEAKDEVVLGSIEQKKAHEVDGLARHLHEQRKLTYTLVLRALCKGDLEFFESSLSFLADVPKPNVHKLLYDSSFMGFQAIYKASGLPENLYEAARLVLELAIEEKANVQDGYQTRIVKRIVTKGYDRTVANMKYMLALMGSGDNPATIH
jgi:uncharacterized protein (DUF2336 family)